MLLMQEIVKQTPLLAEPNAVATALFAAQRLTLVVDGTTVTCSLDGEYVAGAATSWPEVVRIVDTAVSRFIQQYMQDVNEVVMTPSALAADAARYFGILPTQDAAQALLVAWANSVRGTV